MWYGFMTIVGDAGKKSKQNEFYPFLKKYTVSSVLFSRKNRKITEKNRINPVIARSLPFVAIYSFVLLTFLCQSSLLNDIWRGEPAAVRYGFSMK